MASRIGITDAQIYKDIANSVRAAFGITADDDLYAPEALAGKVVEAYNHKYEKGYDNGEAHGYDSGYQEGLATGNEQGYEQGRTEGYESGKTDGLTEGIEQGTAQGLAQGLEQGLEQGRAEGIEQGKQAERVAFWNGFQNNGGTANYYLAFAYGKFTDENYNPIHPIRCSNGSTPGMQMFYNSPGITDTKVEIYANNNNLQGAFNSATGLVTIRKIHVYETTKYTNTFDGANSLINIEFEGVIGQSISFQNCINLSKASHTNIMTHISTTSTLTATFSKSAVNRAFETSKGANDGSTSEEWLALLNAVPNATISLI
jgi:hypothetical protein